MTHIFTQQRTNMSMKEGCFMDETIIRWEAFFFGGKEGSNRISPGNAQGLFLVVLRKPCDTRDVLQTMKLSGT